MCDQATRLSCWGQNCEWLKTYVTPEKERLTGVGHRAPCHVFLKAFVLKQHALAVFGRLRSINSERC